MQMEVNRRATEGVMPLPAACREPPTVKSRAEPVRTEKEPEIESEAARYINAMHARVRINYALIGHFPCVAI